MPLPGEDRPRVVIVLPELSLPFKPPAGIAQRSGLPEIREWWLTFATEAEGVMESHGWNARVVQVPGWEITPPMIERLDADLALVPHRTLARWGRTATPALFYMQSWLPWLFTVDHRGWGAEHSAYPIEPPASIDGDLATVLELSGFVANGVSKFPQPPTEADETLAQRLPTGPWIFFPCQIPHDENVMHHSDVDEKTLVRQIAAWARSPEGVPVVFKPHPANRAACTQLMIEARPDDQRVWWVDNVSVHDLLKRCAAVYTINSGVGFEAMVHGKPVVAWGRSEYDRVAIRAWRESHEPVKPVTSPEATAPALPGAWHEMADLWTAAQAPVDRAAYDRFLTWHTRAHAFDISRLTWGPRLADLCTAALARKAEEITRAPAKSGPSAPSARQDLAPDRVYRQAPRRIFVGFDPRQAISTMVLMMSAQVQSSVPLAITPLMLSTLPLDGKAGLTPFTFSRFLVPWICRYEGWALFQDPDQVWRDDPEKLFALADDRFAVMVVRLEGEDEFERAAVMLFNCSHPDNRRLTPETVKARTTTMIDWTDAIGWLPLTWNHLVGYAKPSDEAQLVHYTQGVPAFPETNGCEHAGAWLANFNAAMMPLGIREAAVPNDAWASIFGASVHAEMGPDGKVRPKRRT